MTKQPRIVLSAHSGAVLCRNRIGIDPAYGAFHDLVHEAIP